MTPKSILITASILATGLATPATADDWSFSVEPYLLAANIEGDSALGRVIGAEVNLDFSTILENLEMAAMLHFEAHSNNGWGLIVDYGFMDLSDDFFGGRGGVVDARVRQGILEGLLVRRSSSQTSGFEYFAGVRWWDNDVDVMIDPAILPGDTIRRVDASWIDLAVGARWTRNINAYWVAKVKGDVGGFGVEANFTSSLAISAVYEFSERYALDLQYKAMWVDFEDGSRGQPGYFSYDTVTHGPIVGFQFNF